MEEYSKKWDLAGPTRNYRPATISDVDLMITQRLHLFHDALVDRGQIKPVPLVHDLHPKAEETD